MDAWLWNGSEGADGSCIITRLPGAECRAITITVQKYWSLSSSMKVISRSYFEVLTHLNPMLFSLCVADAPVRLAARNHVAW